MNAIDGYLRAEIEPLQYSLFFGALVLFGALELMAQRSSKTPNRQRRWPVNFGLTALNILVIGAIPVSGVLLADYAKENQTGVLNLLGLTPIAVFAIGFLARSLISWVIHFAMHRILLLWRVHRTHHSDTHLDVSTTVRFHPIEFLITTPILLAFILATGISPVTLMLYELFDTAMAVLTHANIRIPKRMERVLRYVLVTPDLHRVHHSSWQPETDSNYGATFSIWDHLFGTYREKPTTALQTMNLGLAECQDGRSTSPWWLLTQPFRPLRIPEGSI